MATLYLKAAGGNFNGANWSTTGAAGVDSNTPTAADNCIVELASGNLTINSGSVCRSLDFTSGTGSYTGTATHTAAVTLTIGDGTAGAGNVALKLASGMTYTLGNATSSAITFASTSGTAQTVTTAGKTVGNQTFSGVGGSWQLADTLTMTTAALVHSAGTLDLNGQTVTCLSYAASGAGTKVLTPGAAAVTITRTNSSPLDASGTNLTVSSNTSTWTFSAISSGTVNLGGYDWNGASFLVTSAAQTATTIGANGAIVKDFTWTGPATKTSVCSVTGNLTCTGAFTFNSNSVTNRTFLQSTTQGTVITITAATTSLSNTDIQDITGAGAAAWTGTSMGDSLGNSGITFDSPTTQTNTGATGSWSDATKWTSRVPLPQDTVVVNTGSGTITVDMPRLGAAVSLVGFTGTANFSLGTGMTVYGSLTLTSGATITISQAMTFGGRSTHTLTSAGKSFGSTTTFQGIGGSYTLQDAFTETAGTLTVLAGTFDTNNFSVTTIGFTSSGALTRVVNLGTTTVSLTGTGSGTYWNISGPSALTMSASSSTIALVNASANTRTFVGSTFNYGTLTYTVAGSTGILAVTSFTFLDTFNFSDVTNARTVTFTSGSSFAIRNFNVQGTTGKLMTVKSVTGASPTYLDLVGGYDTVDYLSVQDVVSIIPYKFYAGANSTDVSGNLNISFSAAPSSGVYIDFVCEQSGSGAGNTITFPYGLSATAGQLIHAVNSFSANPGTVTTPTGYSTSVSVATNAYLNGFYKVAAGGETTVISSVSGAPSTNNWKIAVLGGFTGTATLDVTDSNSGTTATSLNTTATTGPTNTDATTIVLANYQGAGSLGASVSTTNSYQWQRYAAEASTYRMLAKRVTSAAANSTLYTWTTSRANAAVLVVYKDVVSASTFKPQTVFM